MGLHSGGTPFSDNQLPYEHVVIIMTLFITYWNFNVDCD